MQRRQGRVALRKTVELDVGVLKSAGRSKNPAILFPIVAAPDEGAKFRSIRSSILVIEQSRAARIVPVPPPVGGCINVKPAGIEGGIKSDLSAIDVQMAITRKVGVAVRVARA